MSFTPDSDTNFLTVKNTVYSRLGNSPNDMGKGQGNHNAGERSHGLDSAQLRPFLLEFATYLCRQASVGGVNLDATAITNATAAAKFFALTGNRSYAFTPDVDSNFTNLQKYLAKLSGRQIEFLWNVVEWACGTATTGGTVLSAAAIQTMLDAARGALIGKRSF